MYTEKKQNANEENLNKNIFTLNQILEFGKSNAALENTLDINFLYNLFYKNR